MVYIHINNCRPIILPADFYCFPGNRHIFFYHQFPGRSYGVNSASSLFFNSLIKLFSHFKILQMNILVRLPNWLGDMVMSTSFMQTLQTVYPGAATDVIVKKGLDSLVDFIPVINKRYIFSRDEWKGLSGAIRFGRKIKSEKKYDLFFCLPDSFSSAGMGWATGATERIGFKKELRSFFLTKSYDIRLI